MSDIVHIGILFILAIAHFVLAIWMLRRYESSVGIKYYSGFLIGVAFVALLNALLLFDSLDSWQITIHRLGFISGMFTFLMFFMFTLYFPLSTARPKSNDHLLWIIPITFFIPFILFNQEFVSGVRVEDGISKEVLGSWYLLFPVILGFYVLWSVYNLVIKIRNSSDPSTRRNIGYILFAFILSGLLAFLVDVVLPQFDVRIPHYIGVETSVLIVMTTAFIVGSKK